MSNEIQTIAKKRIVGSAVKKAVLMYMADCASNDGSGIWTSKSNMALDLEMSKRSVQKSINDFIEAGIVTEVGTRKCKNGFTVEYRINIQPLSQMPSTRDGAASPLHQKAIERDGGGVQEVHPCTGFTPRGERGSPQGVNVVHPNHPLTILEPPITRAKETGTDLVVIGVDHFQTFWDTYPHRLGKKTQRDKAEQMFDKILKSGVTFDDLMAGVAALKRDPDTARGFQRGPIPWLNQRGWTDEIPDTDTPAGSDGTKKISSFTLALMRREQQRNQS